MKNTFKTLWLSSDDWRIIWRTVVAAGLLAIASVLIGYLKPEGATALWSYLSSGVAVLLPRWALIVTLVFITIALFLLALPLLQIAKLSKHEKKYLEDVFDGVRWRWSYIEGNLTNIVPFCAKEGCDTECTTKTDIIPLSEWGPTDSSGTRIFCNNCNSTLLFENVFDLQEHVRIKAEKKIRDNSWKH